MAGSGQEQDADVLLFVSEVTVRDGVCIRLKCSSTCETGADGGFSLSNGKVVLSGTGADEPLSDGLLLCTVDDEEKNLKPSGFTAK